jgi:hypothetical protein
MAAQRSELRKKVRDAEREVGLGQRGDRVGRAQLETYAIVRGGLTRGYRFPMHLEAAIGKVHNPVFRNADTGV